MQGQQGHGFSIFSWPVLVQQSIASIWRFGVCKESLIVFVLLNMSLAEASGMAKEFTQEIWS